MKDTGKGTGKDEDNDDGNGDGDGGEYDDTAWWRRYRRSVKPKQRDSMATTTATALKMNM